MASQVPSALLYHEVIVFAIFLLFLILCRLNNPEPHHKPWPPACRIMDLCPILQLPAHCYIHRKTQMDPMTTLSVPPRYGTIITYEIRRREELCAILIKMSNEVFSKFPQMSLMDRTLISHIWLVTPSNMSPQHIKQCLFTLVFPQAGADLYFDWETVDHRLTLSPNSKRVARIIIPNHLIIYPLVLPFYTCLTNCWEVYSVINLTWLGGKMRRK